MGSIKLNSQRKNVGKRKIPTQKSRKEKRKEKRVQKKKNRQLFNKMKYKSGVENSQAIGNNAISPDIIKLEKNKHLQNHVPIEKKIKYKKNDIYKDKLKLEQELEKREHRKLQIDMAKQRKTQLIAANLQEDRRIQQLEKVLRINKRKNKNVPKSFAADGLDYLLDFCDEENRKIAVETEKQLLGVDSESEFEDDFAITTGDILKTDKERKIKKNSLEQNSENTSFSSDSESDLPFDESSNGNDEDCYTDDEQDNAQYYLEDNNFEGNSTEEKVTFKSKTTTSIAANLTEDNKKKRKFIETEYELKNSNKDCEKTENVKNKTVWEDIYGRSRDLDGNVVANMYIPPAARAKNVGKNLEDSEKLLKLKKQLKGPLNRLTDRNIHTISSQIDELYMTNSRNDMNEMLTKLITEALVSPTITPDRLIIEHMMLIAVLHANIDSEVGAHFLLTVVKRINESLKLPTDIENKELDNLILILSHLYNFNVFGSKLIYEILEKLVEKFTEKEIDLILLILKSVGFVLRKDNPIALKELILRLQQKAGVTKCENSRVKFMLNILLAIKNNNMSKIPQYDPSIMDQMKRLLKTLIRKGNSISQLNITLEDLLKVDEKGKWWIVGAAWSGNSTLSKKEIILEPKPEYSVKLLELARKQRMNTDTRRNIFCILMSAEDFLDAFEKLHHLGLKDGQEKEIIYVLMNCCVQEKKFNPYYAILAQKLCDYDRKYQMTIQYNLWDKLKTLDSLNYRQLMNLARFLAHLFLHKGLSISTMKVIQLEELDKYKMKLIRQILLEILMYENLETCLAVFERITHSDELKPFKEALRLFINQFVVKNMKEGLIPNEKISLIKERIELVDRILITRSSRTVF